jgi:hypothetical protein
MPTLIIKRILVSCPPFTTITVQVQRSNSKILFYLKDDICVGEVEKFENERMNSLDIIVFFESKEKNRFKN